LSDFKEKATKNVKTSESSVLKYFTDHGIIYCEYCYLICGIPSTKEKHQHICVNKTNKKRKKYLYYCIKCGKQYKLKNPYEKHIRTHNSECVYDSTDSASDIGDIFSDSDSSDSAIEISKEWNDSVDTNMNHSMDVQQLCNEVVYYSSDMDVIEDMNRDCNQTPFVPKWLPEPGESYEE